MKVERRTKSSATLPLLIESTRRWLCGWEPPSPAQCHTHKYDPLSQDEYFQIFAILNNTEDADGGDDSPRLQLYTAEQKQRRSAIEARLAELDQLIATPTDAIAASQQQWEARLQKSAAWNIQKPTKITRSGGGNGDPGRRNHQCSDSDRERRLWIEIPLKPGADQKPIAALQIQTIPSPRPSGSRRGTWRRELCNHRIEGSTGPAGKHNAGRSLRAS